MELAERIVELANNPVARARMAATGHQEVRSRYHESAIVDQMEQYLLETVALAAGVDRGKAGGSTPP